MRRTTALAALLLSTTPALAQVLPFEGFWAMGLDTDCENYRDDRLMEIKGRDITALEEYCRVTQVRRDRSRWILSETCNVEETPEQKRTVIYTLNGPDRLLVGSPRQTGFETYYRCPRPENYPVTEVYRGPVVPPKLNTPFARMFRTRIGQAYEDARVTANRSDWIAGCYYEVTWHCEPGDCKQGALVDASTGDVIPKPTTTAKTPVGKLEYDFTFVRKDGAGAGVIKNSRLLAYFGRLESHVNTHIYGWHYFVLENNSLRHLRSVLVELDDAEEEPEKPKVPPPFQSNKFVPNALDTTGPRFVPGTLPR